MGPLVSSVVLVAEALPECTADACDVDSQVPLLSFPTRVPLP